MGLPVWPLLLSPLLLEDMLVPAGMLPTLPVLSMLPSVRLRLSQRLKLMLVFCMEVMAMVVLGMLDLDMDMLLLLLMDTPVLDMPDMEDTVLDMAVVPTLVKHQMQTSKSSKVILLFSALFGQEL